MWKSCAFILLSTLACASLPASTPCGKTLLPPVEYRKAPPNTRMFMHDYWEVEKACRDENPGYDPTAFINRRLIGCTDLVPGGGAGPTFRIHVPYVNTDEHGTGYTMAEQSCTVAHEWGHAWHWLIRGTLDQLHADKGWWQ